MEKWISEEMAIDRGIIRRFVGFIDWATIFGSHAVDEKLGLIKLP